MISKFLLELRGKGWTQEAIAAKAGITHGMVSKYMRGTPCTLETAIKIADAFEVSLDEVIGRTPPKKKVTSNTTNNYAKSTKIIEQRTEG